LKKRIIAFALYTLFWLVFFFAARLLFLLMQTGEMAACDFSTIAGTFIHGFKLDLSTTCYFLLLPLLVAIPGLYFEGRWFIIFMKIYSFFLIIFSTLIVVGDANVYSYWGYRLEFSTIEYLKTPKDAMASLRPGEFFLFVLAVVLFAGAFILICNKLINKFFSSFERVNFLIAKIIIFIVLIATLIIPIRGGTGVAVLNVGSAYFSDKLFPNHAAINVIWNFGHTAAYSKPARNPYSFGDLKEAYGNVRNLTKYSGSTEKVLNPGKPNILIIILESFGSYLTDQPGKDSIVTPRFRELVHEGIYFNNFYAAGSRTDKAIPAIFSGFPNLPTIQIIREPKKTQSLPGIVKLLDSTGYKSSFWYGGDINFANINSFITTSAFREKITMKNFNPENYNSKWGVHDEVLFQLLQDSLLKSRQPFVYSVLTLSSHEPFEVPMEPVFKGKDELSRFKNSVFYTDRSLGNFIDNAKKTDWWKNTLVILLADHCRRYSDKVPVYSQDIYKIPMLWIGGALQKRDTIIKRNGNQFDLPLMIANQLNIKSSFPFSKDLLNAGSNSFSFYTYNEGFAFITDSATAIYDIKLKGNIEEKGKNPSSAEKLGKSFLQVLFDDYLKR
jgi:phosphoglycerol transferase MdoB-like AlkP superfamily enzyme